MIPSIETLARELLLISSTAVLYQPGVRVKKWLEERASRIQICSMWLRNRRQSLWNDLLLEGHAITIKRLPAVLLIAALARDGRLGIQLLDFELTSAARAHHH